jgi:hypothetical protein
MANEHYGDAGLLGVRAGSANASGGESSPQHALGTVTHGNANKTLVYVYAGEVLTASSNVAIAAAFTASVSAGGYVAIQTINSGNYGWVRASAAP